MYDYEEDELTEWLARIRKMVELAPSTYLFFNNCHAGQAVKNARMMMKLLELEVNNPK